MVTSTVGTCERLQRSSKGLGQARGSCCPQETPLAALGSLCWPASPRYVQLLNHS